MTRRRNASAWLALRASDRVTHSANDNHPAAGFARGFEELTLAWAAKQDDDLVERINALKRHVVAVRKRAGFIALAGGAR